VFEDQAQQLVAPLQSAGTPHTVALPQQGGLFPEGMGEFAIELHRKLLPPVDGRGWARTS